MPDKVAQWISSGEVARFSSYMLTKLAAAPESYKKGELREIVVREMKALRAKIGKDLSTVPTPLLKQCQKILWEAL